MGKAVKQTFLLGLLFAMVGFSYALATSTVVVTNSATANVESRGTNGRNPLLFTTEFVPGSTDHDLGDAAFGSSILRWARAKGGTPPHRFSSDTGNTEFQGKVPLATAISALPAVVQPSTSTAVLLLTGRLQGAIGALGASAGTNVPLRFDITVTDSRGDTPNTKTETFRLNMVDSSVFKFGQSTLNDAVTFRAYFDKVEVIAGQGPYTFSITPTPTMTTGMTLTDSSGNVTAINSLLDDMGFFLNAKTGAITGRPLQAGLFAFHLDCTDKAGTHAKSRDLSIVGQLLTISIEDNPRLSSDLFSTKIDINGDTNPPKGNKDTIKYSGAIAVGDNTSSLDGNSVTLFIGNYTSPSVQITGGKGSTPKGSAPSMNVTLGSGFLKINIGNEGFGQTGSILSDITQTQSVLPVTVSIGTASTQVFLASELLRFNIKAKGTKFQMSYKFGPGNIGGGFFITSTQGKDDAKAATDFDAWKSTFVLLLPPNSKAQKNFGTVKNIVTGIGTDFTNSIGVINSGSKLGTGEKRNPTDPVVTKVGLDNKSGKGFVQTGFLPKTSTTQNLATSISSAANSTKKKTRFPLIVQFKDANGNEIFGGENGITIFAKGTTWASKTK